MRGQAAAPCKRSLPPEPALNESLPIEAIERVTRRTLHAEVVDRIRDMIIEGQLAPGTRVHEGQLGAALGISRTPLREALKYLASEGLVDLVAGRGAVVRKLKPRDIQDMLAVLSALEAMAGKLACQNATDDQIRGVRQIHDRMMRHYARKTRLEYYKCNQMIHTAIAELSGNAFLASTQATIQARLKQIRYLGNAAPEKWKGAVAEHEEMITALEARDGERLADVLIRHMDRTWDRVTDSL